MSRKRAEKQGTFLINIIEQKNSTWQGTVTWAEKQTKQFFKSELELIRLIDQALAESIETKGGSHEK